MRQKLKVNSGLFLLGFIFLECLFAWFVLADRGEAPLVLRPPVLKVEDVRSRQQMLLDCTIANPNPWPVSLIGVGVGCGANGCTDISTEFPVAVPANGSIVMQIEFQAGAPGKQRRAVPFYVDSKLQPKLVLMIESVVDS